MLRTAIACSATAALAIAASASAGLVSLRLKCRDRPSVPQAGYGADWNMGPLFSVIDNPVALRYFRPMASHTFALGRNATPGKSQTRL